MNRTEEYLDMPSHITAGGTTLERLRRRYESTAKKCPDCGFVSVPDEDLQAIREDIRAAVDDATDADLGPVTLDASERRAIAEEVAEVLRE